ncbi:hypothetical protein OS493_034474 [Desmophyllum pertusum]|uniref:RING-type domain-containing protein n=1 Tax=Desmophyllum pertusum TaxID=174260 RepID=A0A9X0CWY3_9CNID|nr:hypothetical protein OS493_034474 [Desmophyllum pertusum]
MAHFKCYFCLEESEKSSPSSLQLACCSQFCHKECHETWMNTQNSCGLCRAHLSGMPESEIEDDLFAIAAIEEENSETEDEDDDNDQSSIRAMLPAPSEIRNMTNEEAMERLRSLLPDNMLAEQLEAFSPWFLLETISQLTEIDMEPAMNCLIKLHYQSYNATDYPYIALLTEHFLSSDFSVTFSPNPLRRGFVDFTICYRT